jgi:hypothetical protein
MYTYTCVHLCTYGRRACSRNPQYISVILSANTHKPHRSAFQKHTHTLSLFLSSHAYLHTCIHACIHTRMYVYTHGCMYVCKHACNIYIYISYVSCQISRARMRVCMHACMYVCMHVCMYYRIISTNAWQLYQEKVYVCRVQIKPARRISLSLIWVDVSPSVPIGESPPLGSARNSSCRDCLVLSRCGCMCVCVKMKGTRNMQYVSEEADFSGTHIPSSILIYILHTGSCKCDFLAEYDAGRDALFTPSRSAA